MINNILKLTKLFFLQYTEIIPKIIEFFIPKKELPICGKLNSCWSFCTQSLFSRVVAAF